jgi:hypothetical protein
LKGHRAKAPIALKFRHPFLSTPFHQLSRKARGVTFENPIQISHTGPSSAMALMKQAIPHSTTNNCQSIHTCTRRRRTQLS